jgi:hypothetical protein
MSKFDQQMREMERSLAQLGGKTQATKIRKSLEKKIQMAAAKKLPDIALSLVKSGRAGWANDPDTPGGAVLVERGTGCVLLDPKGKAFQRSNRVNHPPTSGIDEVAFIQHLRTAGNEDFVPYLYKDSEEFVTVGIGHQLRNASDTKIVPFVERGTNKSVHDNHKINAFNKVRNSPISGQAGASAFRPLTNIVISEADAIKIAEDDLREFIGLLRHGTYFPEFDSYPETAKLGLLDMAYNLGVDGTTTKYPDFTLAVRHRDWNLAARESDRPQLSSGRNQTVFQWFKQAEQQQKYFASVICTKRIKLFFG